MFDKQTILDEIKRTASLNGGKPLGRVAFERETGIREYDWSGKHWTRWSDAVIEAGFPPNKMMGRLEDEALLRVLAMEIRRLGRFPTRPELQMRRRQDPTFPSNTVISNRGTQSELAAQIVALSVEGQGEFDDIVPVLTEIIAKVKRTSDAERDTEPSIGSVYLLKLGKHYKIGRTNAFGRRERELAIQMPERAITIHVITTDDPIGIEAYWHRRFADKRVRRDAEWFDLSAADVSAFKRRKFQ